MLMGANAVRSVRGLQYLVGRNTAVVNGRGVLLNKVFPIAVTCVCFNLLECSLFSAAGQVWKWW